MKINFKLSFSNILGILVLVFFSFAPQSIHATYLASDLLGQLDENDQPIYTKNGANNGPSNQGFSGPLGVALDTVHHRLFVAENFNRRVVVFNLDNSNNLLDRVADNVLGQADLFTTVSATTDSGMAGPQGLAYDATNDRLFVADTTNNRVLIFDVSTITDGENAINVLGQPDFTTSALNTTQNGMRGPGRVSYDSGNNRLFVADTTNNRVLVFDLTTVTNGMNALYVLGQPDFTTSSAGTTQSKMSVPGSPVYDSSNQILFVPEFSNNRVTVWNVNPATISSGLNALNVLGQALFTTATAATTQAGLSGPADASYDSTNNRLFVSGFNNNRVTVYDVSTITDGENAINVLGQTDFITSTAATTQSSTRSASGQAYDAVNNRLYVAERDNNRVNIFDVVSITDGEDAVNVLGQFDENAQPIYTKSGSNNGTNNRGFGSPRGVAFDSVGHHFFVSNGNRILVYNLDSNNEFIDRVADNVIGQLDFSTSSFVLDASHVGDVYQIEYDSKNQRLFVVQWSTAANRVSVFDVAQITNGEDSMYVLGQPDFITSTANITQSGVNRPLAVAYDSSNERLFVGDSNNHRVLVYNVAPGVIANGENASYVLGQPDFITNTSGTTQTSLKLPNSLAYDSVLQRLFVSEQNNNRVTVFDVNPATIANGMAASYVLGQSNFTSSAAANTAGGLSTPTGVHYDSTLQQLFVNGFGNNRITIYDVAPGVIANGQNAIAVLGQSDFVSSSSATLADRLSRPYFTTYNAANNILYVSDTSNNRIMIYKFIELSDSVLDNATISKNYSYFLSTTNDQGSASYAVVSGSLPAGLSLNTSTGEISGVATETGNFTFSVQATDDNGAIGYFLSQPQEYTLTVEEPTSSNTSGSRPRARTTTYVPELTTPTVQEVILTTPSTTNYTFTRTLRIKDTGEDVKELQKYLNTHGYPVAITGPGSLGNETTKFGLFTHYAVMKFQGAKGLTPDGIVGPLTRAFLK